ncbi:MAG: hypothetical protein LUQ17_04530 [Methanomicrobiales archaeon]|nr:hypothetical protein [Methanomicrobiales archaeon]
MDSPVEIEIFGYTADECGPFPCDDQRSCGLDECHPEGGFCKACTALENALKKEFGDRVRVRVTLLDDGVPDRIRKIVEEHHPAVPIVLIDGRLVPLGRISLSHMKRFLTGIRT